MKETYNKHYITVDNRGRLTDAWSDGPFPDKETAGAICINEQGGYQFRLTADGEENPPLYTRDGIPLYKWDGEAVALRSREELEADRLAVPAPGPTEAERLEAQATYTAMMTDTLLRTAQEGTL